VQVAANAAGKVSLMERSILGLLHLHESLGFEQIVAHVDGPPDVVRSALTDLRDSGLVSVLSAGETEGHMRAAASYWTLTDRGRQELAGPSSD
jgi:DNA-binding PadR family transcriptional regulator